MNFSDKFLSFCFKIGKVIFSFLLLIAMVVTLILWVKTGIDYYESSKIKIHYDFNVKSIINNMYAEDLGIKQNTTENNSPTKLSKEEIKAFEILNKFIDDNKLPASYKESVQMPTDDKEKVAFIQNFVSFYESFKTEFIEIVKNKTKFDDNKINLLLEQNKEDLYNDAMNAYINAYTNEVKIVKLEKQTADLKKQASLMASLISLAIFILFLFLPILIRIEENTRNK